MYHVGRKPHFQEETLMMYHIHGVLSPQDVTGFANSWIQPSG